MIPNNSHPPISLSLSLSLYIYIYIYISSVSFTPMLCSESRYKCVGSDCNVLTI